MSSEISSINRFFPEVFDRFPALSDCGRHALILDLRVHSRNSLRECTLHELALRISCSEEGTVNDKQHPGTLRERDRGKKNTKP